MGFRKLRAKKYSGVYEYFKDSDIDKRTIAYYIAYRDIDNKIKKVKCNAITKEDALKILNDKRTELAKDRTEIQKDKSLLSRKIMNNNLSLEDVAKLYFPTKTIKSAEMIESDLATLNRTYKSSMLKLVKVERNNEKKSLHK